MFDKNEEFKLICYIFLNSSKNFENSRYCVVIKYKFSAAATAFISEVRKEKIRVKSFILVLVSSEIPFRVVCIIVGIVLSAFL